MTWVTNKTRTILKEGNLTVEVHKTKARYIVEVFNSHGYRIMPRKLFKLDHDITLIFEDCEKLIEISKTVYDR